MLVLYIYDWIYLKITRKKLRKKIFLHINDWVILEILYFDVLKNK